MAACKIIFIADVVGKPGRHILSQMTRRLKVRHEADFAIVNVENSAGGFGITPEMAKKVFAYGVDCQTSGNHIWDRQGIDELLRTEPRLIRPANYPDSAGSGLYVGRAGEIPIAVINVMGRTFMHLVDCPFRTTAGLVDSLNPSVKIVIVDMHAEATSEKQAMLYYLDGKVSAIIGTHTHVQTADEQVSGRGTAYITDVGMTGAHDSVLGMKKGQALARLMTGRPVRMSAAEDNVLISGVVLEIDPSDGRAKKIERFKMEKDLSLPLGDGMVEEETDVGEAD